MAADWFLLNHPHPCNPFHLPFTGILHLSLQAAVPHSSHSHYQSSPSSRMRQDPCERILPSVESCLHNKACGILCTTPCLSHPDDLQSPTHSPCYPGPFLSITTIAHEIFKWHLRLCHYPQGVEQATQEEESPHFHRRPPERWIPLDGWSGEKVGCSFSPSKVPRPTAVVAVSPRKQTRNPKVSFLLLHSRVYSGAGTGLYHSGCSPANRSLFGLQPLCSPTPLWRD